MRITSRASRGRHPGPFGQWRSSDPASPRGLPSYRRFLGGSESLQTLFSIITAGCLALAGPATLAAAAEVDAERVLKLGKVFAAAAATVEKAVDGGTIALVVAPSEKPVEGESDEPGGFPVADLERVLLEAMLARSLLIFAVDEDDELDIFDEEGRLSKRLVLGKPNITRLTKESTVTHLALVEVGEVRERIAATIELFGLERGRRTLAARLLNSKPEDVESLREVTFLPMRNTAVLAYAIRNIGKQVDRGECWDLPAVPLKATGFSPPGYNFGRKVSWEEALPGDVLSIDNEKYHHVMVLLKSAEKKTNARILHQGGGLNVELARFPEQYVDDIVVWRPGESKE